MDDRSKPHPLNAVPAIVACVAIAFGALAAERKLNPGESDASGERRSRPFIAPAPLAARIPGDTP